MGFSSHIWGEGGWLLVSICGTHCVGGWVGSRLVWIVWRREGSVAPVGSQIGLIQLSSAVPAVLTRSNSTLPAEGRVQLKCDDTRCAREGGGSEGETGEWSA